jgi:hypothetical protein
LRWLVCIAFLRYVLAREAARFDESSRSHVSKTIVLLK